MTGTPSTAPAATTDIMIAILATIRGTTAMKATRTEKQARRPIREDMNQRMPKSLMFSTYALRKFFISWVISWGIGGIPHAIAQVPVGGSVSVMAFGAKGDGVTDDRAAIQAAIDSVSAGAVYFPPAAGGYL